MKSLCLSYFLMFFGNSWSLFRGLIIVTLSLAPIFVSASSAIQQKLDTIVFPQVNFSGMELTRVLETLSELSVEFDPERVGVNIVPLFDPDESNPRVNISLRNLSLRRCLTFVADQVGYTYSVGKDAVTVEEIGGESVVSDEQVVDLPEGDSSVVDSQASPQQSRVQVILSNFGVSFLTLKFLIIGVALGLLPFFVLLSRFNDAKAGTSNSSSGRSKAAVRSNLRRDQ
jgi:hypothetical protein